jgi:tryptophan synthase alpha chain
VTGAAPPGEYGTQPARAASSFGPLEASLRAARDSGRKLLVPYLMAGTSDDWVDVVRAVADAGADAVEIGIPFSDPVIDGPTIQEAGLRALRRGTTPNSVLRSLERADVGVPLVVMTYYNVVSRAGERRFARSLAEVDVAGAILPDLPLEEATSWCDEADSAGVDTVLLVAPSTPDERARAICARCRGFVYGVGIMGVTGERPHLAAGAAAVGERLRSITDVPVCIGIGVSNPDQAREAVACADGVVVGSALVRRLLEGAGPLGAGVFVSELRAGIDNA